MTVGILNLQMLGRFGNQAMQYLAARAIAERDNLELRTPRWVGEKIFQIEPTAEPDYSGEFCHGYQQNQDAAIYTLTQVREWFRFQDWVRASMRQIAIKPKVVGHVRRGDFKGYNYPQISLQSYYNACHKFAVCASDLCFVMEESPISSPWLSDEVSWLTDFCTMANADVLFRANSSFSFVAGMLCIGRVFSPRIDGLAGGEQLVEFEAGNHCCLANHSDFTDLHIKP